MLTRSAVLDKISSKKSVELISATAAIVVASAWVLAFQGASAPVEAHSQEPTVRVDKCTQQAWPYYQGSCLKDRTGEIRAVRIVTVDRAPASNSIVTAEK